MTGKTYAVSPGFTITGLHGDGVVPKAEPAVKEFKLDDLLGAYGVLKKK